jgi:hypothetical protein
MARNRKSESAAVRFGPALKAVLLCLLIGGSGVGYVWQKEQIAKLGHTIKLKEAQVATLESHNDYLRRQLYSTRSPDFLLRRIKEGNLGLIQPPEDQIIRLPEPVVTSAHPAPPQYALYGDRHVFAP